MKQPEHMMADECHKDPLSDDEMRVACRAYIDNLRADDVRDFLECYIDPEGPMRYGGDAWDALEYYLTHDPQVVFDACRQDARENR